VKLIAVPSKQDFGSRETKQDTTHASLIDSIADLNLKTSIEEKLKELDSKNDTIHVCSYHFIVK